MYRRSSLTVFKLQQTEILLKFLLVFFVFRRNMVGTCGCTVYYFICFNCQASITDIGEPIKCCCF
jgi:hypothetical protein